MKIILYTALLIMLNVLGIAAFAADCGNAGQCFQAADTAIQAGRFSDALTAGRSGCEQGSGDACTVVGILYQFGKGIGQDTAQSVTYLQKACDLGSGDGCATLAGIYYNGSLGVPLDLEKAYRLAMVGCQADNAIACMVL